MFRFLTPICLGALLLFLIQPMTAKAILPTHGGAAGVWTACLVFYQCGLLAGYLYAFLLVRIPPITQAIVHGLLLVASLFFLPISAPAASDSNAIPEWDILLGLSRSIGLPYVLLSSTSPLLQSWRGQQTDDARVFRWFAISNLGSLLGLLAYPFVIEPFSYLEQQQWGWTIGYVTYVALIGVLMATHFWSSKPVANTHNDARITQPSEAGQGGAAMATWSFSRGALCMVLAACSTIVLGASTTQMSQSGVVVPFLWVLPLTLYLASFVICFQWAWLARPTLWIRVYFVAGFVACGLLFAGALLPIPWQIAGYAFLVLACSMACHAQLHAIRPATKHLALYYLLIALGGALGGAFTGLLAPRIFSEYWEFHVGIALGALMLAACEFVRLWPRLRTERYASNVLVPANLLATVFILILLWIHFDAIRSQPIVERRRDFFGVVSVLDDEKSSRRLMLHGKTQHGAQPLHENPSAEQTLYFTPQSGVAKAIEWRRASLDRPIKLGVIGLGTGSLLVHARPGDRVDFYEISPAVNALARKHFSYLSNHQGEVAVAIGDGRQLLAKEIRTHGSREFDVLIIDAFSGDALPMHLLTIEALELYNSHLAEDGLLAFQITNRYLDLAPILEAAAKQTNRRTIIVETAPPATSVDDEFKSNVRWAILAPAHVSGAELPAWAKSGVPVSRIVAPWTDEFGSLWSALR